MLSYILLRLHIFFWCVRFSFSVLGREIGWEERLRNDLFCAGWDVKSKLNHCYYCRSLVLEHWTRNREIAGLNSALILVSSITYVGDTLRYIRSYSIAKLCCVMFEL